MVPTSMIPTRDAWLAHLAALEAGLLERGVAVRLMLLAVLAREHVLLIGPPGTAKSALARRLHHAFAGLPLFEHRIRSSTSAEELFVPQALPAAGIAVLDEVFEAGSAVLNPLLRLIDDREVETTAGRQAAPLVTLIGTSSDVPTEVMTAALLDRLLLRLWVGPIGDASFEPLLSLRDTPSTIALAPLTPAHLQALASAAQAVVLGDQAQGALQALRHVLQLRDIGVSDRRWRRFVHLLQVAAASEGRAEVDAIDLWLASHVMSIEPAAQEALDAWFDAQIRLPAPKPLPWPAAAAAAFEQQLQLEGSLPAADPPAAPTRTIGVTQETGGLVRLRAARQEQQARRHFSSQHVAARLAQLDEVAARVEAVREPAQTELQHLDARLAGRVWLPPERIAQWTAAHRQRLAMLDAVAARLARCREGFAALPIDEVADTPAAPPVVWPTSSSASRSEPGQPNADVKVL